MITLAQTYTAINAGNTSSFLASGGTAPYAYGVPPNGAGGTIDPVAGLYTAPATVGRSPQTLFDTIQVTDSLGATTTAKILVGHIFQLFCDVIQTYMNLPVGRVYMWDQKIMQPTDEKLFIPIYNLNPRPFANTTKFRQNFAMTGLNQIQTTVINATMQIEVKSRSTEAFDRKEEVIQALHSYYSLSQQEKNGFKIFEVPEDVVNLSEIDGAAIPYRFAITTKIQYRNTKVTPVPYYDTYQVTQVTEGT
jgi:hypothetical protein